MEKSNPDTIMISELDIQQLKPYPLPKALSKLPIQFLDTFAKLYELTRGYIKSLNTYQTKEQELRGLMNQIVLLINTIIHSIEEHNHYAETIQSQIRELDILFKEFSVLETNQYQLLSANFNQSFLMAKYKNLLQQEDDRATLMTNEFHKGHANMGEFLNDFRESRKIYHYRREKVTRWEEDRVSGFI